MKKAEVLLAVLVDILAGMAMSVAGGPDYDNKKISLFSRGTKRPRPGKAE